MDVETTLTNPNSWKKKDFGNEPNLVNQDYSDKNKVDIVTSVKRLITRCLTTLVTSDKVWFKHLDYVTTQRIKVTFRE